MGGGGGGVNGERYTGVGKRYETEGKERVEERGHRPSRREGSSAASRKNKLSNNMANA